jgi:hypothetical protein
MQLRSLTGAATTPTAVGRLAWSPSTCTVEMEPHGSDQNDSAIQNNFFLDIGYQIRPLHPEMYTAKSYKRREKQKREKTQS